MKKRNLFLVLATAIMLIIAACSGEFVDPSIQNNSGGGGGTCPPNSGGGGGSGGGASATFTMTGNYSSYCSCYSYTFANYSNYTVQVTVNGETKTMHPYPLYTGDYAVVDFSSSYSSTISVKYSPSNKVRYETASQSTIR